MENAATVGNQLPVFTLKAHLDSLIKKLYGHFGAIINEKYCYMNYLKHEQLQSA